MRTLAGYLSHAIADLPADPRSIYDVVLVGNSTMRDLFFRQSVYTIGQNPYRSITEIEMAEGKRTTTSLTTTGRRSLLPIHPERPRLRTARSSAATWAPTQRHACWPSISRTRIGSSRSWTSARTPSCSLGNRHRILAASCPGRPGVRRRRDRMRHAGPRRRDRGRRAQRRRDVPARRDRRRSAGRHLRIRARRSAERAAPDRPHECDGPLRGRHRPGHARRRPATSIFSNGTSTSWRRRKAPTSPVCRSCSADYGIQFDDIAVFYLAGGFGRHLKRVGVEAHRAHSQSPRRENRAGWQCGARGRDDRSRLAPTATGTRGAGEDESSTAGSKRTPGSSTSSSMAASSGPSSRGTRVNG